MLVSSLVSYKRANVLEHYLAEQIAVGNAFILLNYRQALPTIHF